MFFSLNRILTLLSYGLVPVSLVHTVKATIPFFNVILSTIVLHQHFSCNVYISLIPIIAGVMLSSVSEVEYFKLFLDLFLKVLFLHYYLV